MSAAGTDGAQAPYPHVESPDLPAIEQRILERWETAATFEKSVEQRPHEDEYVFFVDADIHFNQSDTLERLVGLLHSSPEVHIATTLPQN